jgi:photosystem II stability/assembly factor-like uncharacterized protein
VTVCISPGGRAISTGSDAARRAHVATIDGVWSLERAAAGEPWSVAVQTLKGRHIGTLVHLADERLLFAGAHSGGLFVSADDGLTWDSAMQGIGAEHEHVFTIAAFGSGRETVLWAGTQPAALYRSTDLGRTWSEVPGIRTAPGTDAWNFPAPPFIAHVKHIAIHPNRPDVVFVCVEQGALLKSNDAGATWREITSYATAEDRWYHDAHRIVFSPSDPSNVYLTSGEGLYHSLDAGETWSHLTTRHDRVGYPDALLMDPGDERIMYMAGGGKSPDAWIAGAAGSAYSGILRSVDAGASWTECHAGLPKPIRGNFEAMSLHRWSAQMSLYAATALGEVFERAGRDSPWERIAGELPPISKVGHYKRFFAQA